MRLTPLLYSLNIFTFNIENLIHVCMLHSFIIHDHKPYQVTNKKKTIFLFFFQYRAAVSSSVHSTPSKSFINPNSSSPQSTTSNSSSSRHNSPNQSMNKNNYSQPPVLPPHAYALQQKQRSFLTFGFGAGGSGPSRRESHVNVNVTPTSHDASSDTPEIRKYKKRFNSEILCAALWGVNLLIGTENGLMLLDRSGQGKVSCCCCWKLDGFFFSCVNVTDCLL